MQSLKHLQKQLKTIIPSMSQNQLTKIIKHIEQIIGSEFLYVSRELSYKCYEGSLSFKDKKAIGYGRTNEDAYLNAIKNIMEILIEEDNIVFILKHHLKNLCSQDNKQNQSVDTFVTKSQNLLNSMSTQSNSNNNINFQNHKKSKSQIKPVFIESLNISMSKGLGNRGLQQQLKAAKSYIFQLEQKIKIIQEQNRNLKSKNYSVGSHGLHASYFGGSESISNTINKGTMQVRIQKQVPRVSLKGKDVKSVYVRNQKLNLSIQDLSRNNKQQTELRKSDVKQKIPKLKLSMLPNYHGKSNKSMNQSLLIKQK